MHEIPLPPPQDPRRERTRPSAELGLELARTVATDAFGFDGLRASQELALRPVLEGRDALIVMPTGAGKSAIYQLAALVGAGPAVVVSPLLALQRDQVQSLAERLPGAAAAWNSTMGVAARREVRARWLAGDLPLLYLAPESLDSAAEMLALRPPRLVVVDESHCVLEWGHDFRPDYLTLPEVFETWGRPPVLALTATASPPAREEVARLLGLREPEVQVAGFDRPEIHLAVERFVDADAKREALLAAVEAEPGAGIVYCATREAAEGIAEDLRARGVASAAYHGGLGRADRERVQDEFMRNDLRVVAATVAFGLGVDKPDVRFVKHLDPPASLDAYYQEAGRAGRDGRPARATLHWSPDDVTLQRFLGGALNLPEETLERVAAVLGAVGEPVEPEEIGDELGLSDSRVYSVIRRLEEVGAVEIAADGTVSAARGMDPAEAARAAVARQDQHRRYVRSRLDMLKAYAEGTGCRRAFLLGYFGEPFEGPCGHCDVCDGTFRRDDSAGDALVRAGDRVEHDAFGAGEVTNVAEGKVTVRFEDRGYVQLTLEHVLERQLLRRAEPAAEPGA